MLRERFRRKRILLLVDGRQRNPVGLFFPLRNAPISHIVADGGVVRIGNVVCPGQRVVRAIRVGSFRSDGRRSGDKFRRFAEGIVYFHLVRVSILDLRRDLVFARGDGIRRENRFESSAFGFNICVTVAASAVLNAHIDNGHRFRQARDRCEDLELAFVHARIRGELRVVRRCHFRLRAHQRGAIFGVAGHLAAFTFVFISLLAFVGRRFVVLFFLRLAGIACGRALHFEGSGAAFNAIEIRLDGVAASRQWHIFGAKGRCSVCINL